jgi:hypothetical protein
VEELRILIGVQFFDSEGGMLLNLLARIVTAEEPDSIFTGTPIGK